MTKYFIALTIFDLGFSFIPQRLIYHHIGCKEKTANLQSQLSLSF
ncbi:hypothetical protein [Metabacillus fastidiosus]|nr:hypothetical protein [Metabacillus fastidiosus]